MSVNYGVIFVMCTLSSFVLQLVDSVGSLSRFAAISVELICEQNLFFYVNINVLLSNECIVIVCL